MKRKIFNEYLTINNISRNEYCTNSNYTFKWMESEFYKRVDDYYYAPSLFSQDFWQVNKKLHFQHHTLKWPHEDWVLKDESWYSQNHLQLLILADRHGSQFSTQSKCLNLSRCKGSSTNDITQFLVISDPLPHL